MSSTFKNLLIWIVVISIIAVVGIQVMDFISSATDTVNAGSQSYN